MERSNGQAAVEYLTVFGIALLLSTPFIVRAQDSLMEIQSSSNTVEVRNSLNNLETAVERVSASGEPAAMTFFVEVPHSVNETSTNDRSVVVSLNTESGTVSYSRVFDVNLTGSYPSVPGRHRVKARAEGDKVVLEVTG